MAKTFAAFVLFFAAGKIVLVREYKNYKKPGPPRVVWWKAPGGRHDPERFPNESPKQCAIRRFFGETGICLTEDELELHRVIPVAAHGDVKEHDKYFYSVRRDVFPELLPYGDRYNEIGTHTPEAFLTLVEDEEAHPEHVEMIKEFLNPIVAK